MTTYSLIARLAVASLALVSPEALAQTASFQGLGVLSGQTTSVARALSADGSVVIGTSGSSGFVWTAPGGLVNLGNVGTGVTNTPIAVSRNGQRITGTSSLRGYSWTASTGIQDLGLLPSATTNTPAAISADGSVIVGNCNNFKGYIWTTSGGIAAINPPDDRLIAATGVSTDGTQVLTNFSGRSPYLLSIVQGGQVTPLPPVPGDFLGCSSGIISGDGSTVVGRSYKPQASLRLAIWTGPTTPTTPAPDQGIPNAISDDGSVIVGVTSQTPPFTSFILHSGQLTLLTSPDSIVLSGVSADGQIISGTARRGTPLAAEPILVINGQILWLKDELQSRGVDVSAWTATTSAFISRDGTAFCGGGTVGGASQAWRAIRPRN